MPTMGQGAIENGGLGGTYTTTNTTTSNPLAPEAIATQASQQNKISTDYNALIQQALDMYNPLGTKTVVTGASRTAAPSLATKGTVTYRDNQTGQTYTVEEGSRQAQMYQQMGMNSGRYTGIASTAATYDRNPDAGAAPTYQEYLAWHRQTHPGSTAYTPEQYAANINKFGTATASTGSATGTALQQALDALGTMSNADNYGSNLLGAGANNGTDLIDRSTFQPYMDAGANAANEWQALAGLGDNPLTAQQISDRYLSSPGVQAQLNTGQQALNANFGSKGLTGSSSIMKALTSFGQGIASQNIGAAQDRLLQMAGLGATSANQYASQLNQNYSTNVNAQLQNQQLQQQAANSRGSLANLALANQTGLLSSLGSTNAQLQSASSLARMQALIGSLQNQTSTKIDAPILETTGQTMMGMGSSAAGTAAGVAMMALLGI